MDVDNDRQSTSTALTPLVESGPTPSLIRALSSRFNDRRRNILADNNNLRAPAATAADYLVIRNDSAHIIAAVAPTLFTNSAPATTCGFSAPCIVAISLLQLLHCQSPDCSPAAY